MEFQTYVRKPFKVEAILITDENIEELAKNIGRIDTKPNGDKFIQVDEDLVPNVPRVYPGFWMTKMGSNIRCYSPYAFGNQFLETDDAIDEWIAYMNNKSGDSNADTNRAEGAHV